MNTPRQQENPYMTATPVPRATAPLNAIGVLGDTQASITHAQNAIATYGYNLDAERDRAQQRVVKDTFYPYAVAQTNIMGRAGVLGAQADQQQAGNRALYMGVPIDQFDPLVGDQGILRQGGRILYGGIDAPTTLNPTMKQSQYEDFSRRGFATPYQIGGDADAQGQLTPLANPNAAAAASGATVTAPYTGPLSRENANIPGIPGNVLGVDRNPQPPRPMATDEERRAFDTNQGIIKSRIQQLDAEIAAADAASPVSPYGLSRGLTDPRAESLRLARADLVNEMAAMRLPGHIDMSQLGQLPSEYGFSSRGLFPAATGQGVLRDPQGTFGADAMPEAAPNATSFEPPLAMVRQAPALVPRFKNTAAVYAQHAPGGPGGVEAALLINALESDFRPGVKADSSSATGGAQFTGDTWKKGARKWKMPWAEGKTDEELLALRSSPPHMAQMERAMRMQNLSIATSDKYAGKFDPHNPLNLYAMHHFNPERGADLAASLRTRPNASVASVFGPDYWNTALAANPHLAPNGRSMTVAELYTYWINEGKKRGFYGGVTA